MRDEKRTDVNFSIKKAGNDSSGEDCKEAADGAVDKELNTLLKQWQAPAVSAALDMQVTATYRRELHRPPFWRRVFTTRIGVPVPIAAGVLMVLAATSFLAVRSFQPSVAKTDKTVAQITQAKVLEPPANSEAGTAPHEAPAANPDRNAGAERAASGSAYITKVDLTGFKPVKTLTIRHLPRGNSNER
jgi:hypothetical protein